MHSYSYRKILVKLACIFRLDNWDRRHLGELPLKCLHHFHIVKFNSLSIHELFLHLVSKLFKGSQLVCSLLSLLAITVDLVIDNLIVLLHLPNHLPLNIWERSCGDLAIFSQVEKF